MPGAAPGECTSFPGPVGSFVRRQWERSGLLPIAQRLVSGKQLAEEELQQLARAELPLLAKLVEHKRTAILPTSGQAGSGIVQANHPEEADAAATIGFRVLCRQELRSESGSRPGLPPRFLQELRRWDAWCRSVKVARTWILVLPAPLETGVVTDSQPLGEEVLRAIAVASLVLPNEVEIQASVVDFGIKTAQVSLDFGATRLGLPAADRQMAGAGGVPLCEEVQRVLNLAQPTPVDGPMPESFRRDTASKRPLPQSMKTK